MRPKWLRAILVLSCVAGIPLDGAAQILTPAFMAPRTGSTLGLYLSDAGSGDLALEGIMRRSFGDFDLGVRGGIIDAGGTQITLGAEYRNPIVIAAPVDLAVTAGAQGVFGDFDWLAFQAGLTLGTTVVPGTFAVSPYIHPRLGLVDGPGSDGFETELLAELGLDLEFANRVAARISIGLDDLSPNWGLGITWR